MTHTLNRTFRAIAAVALLAITACVAFAQGPPNFPPTQVYARAYAAWNIIGQQANTYTFNGLSCNFTPYNNGATASFFAFSGQQNGSTVYFPVFIQDANPALNEVVTPTSTTQGSASCGFAATTSNTHTSFTLSSGTAGLQEAIANQPQNTPVFTVLLDKFWYQLVAALPSSSTPQSIISTVTGNANVGIVDTTTNPYTYYAWNGTKYAPLASTGGIPFNSVTQVSAPTALSTSAATNGLITTAATGGSIGNAGSTYRLCATYVTALGGETACSTDSTSASTIATGTSTSTNTIAVTSPAAATGAVGWRLYVSAASGASGSEILYAPACTASSGQIVLNGVCAIGSSATVTAIVTGTADVPPISSAFAIAGGSASPLQSIVSYPPFPSLASISAGSAATMGVVNFAPGFLNVLGRHLHLHGMVYGSTNATPGTLTTAVTLASVSGVTSITPFTAVSGTTTASAVINAVFDVDITTAAVGSSGTLEAHGTVCYNLAGTAVASCTEDLIVAVSSTVDLTKQDQLAITLKPTTTATTTSQLRQLTVQVLQ